jgi:hypothetical protein
MPASQLLNVDLPLLNSPAKAKTAGRETLRLISRSARSNRARRVASAPACFSINPSTPSIAAIVSRSI